MHLKIKTDPAVTTVYDNYPDIVREKISNLRDLIINTAQGIEGIEQLEETLKWNEPSFLVKKGSTIRIDWKKTKPNQYCMYFKCTSKLVTTFRVLYKDTFKFEGNRAIIFPINSPIVATQELKSCITAALTYHKIKHLPTLGI